MVRFTFRLALLPAAAIFVVFLCGCHSSKTHAATKLSSTDQTAAEIAMAEAAEANGLQAVLVHVKVTGQSGSLKERQEISKLEEQLNQALKRNGFDESDGDEFDNGDCIIYLYALDAEALYSCVEPVLKSCPLRKKIYAVKRFGPPGARESRVELPEPAKPPVQLPYAQPPDVPAARSSSTL